MSLAGIEPWRVVISLSLMALLAVASPAQTSTNPFTLDPATPAPQQLQQIGRTHSRALCTAIRRSVIPALQIAKKNDVRFGDGRKAIYSYTMQPEGLGKDYQLFRLDQATLVAMQKNLDEYDKLLDDPALVPRSAREPLDITLIENLRKGTQAPRAAQRVQVDTLSGFLETERFNRYRKLDESEQTAANALGQGNLPQPHGDQKVQNDYYNYFRDPRGSSALLNAHAIDDDLGGLRDVTLKIAYRLQATANDGLKDCSR